MAALNKIVSNFDTPANLSLLLTLVWVIEQKFAYISSSSVLIGQYAETKANELEHKDLIEDVLKRVSGSANVKYILESDNGHENFSDFFNFEKGLNNEELFFRTFGRKSKAIWFIDSLTSFWRLEKDLLNERLYYKRNGYFCIVYTGNQMDFLTLMRLIFRRLFKLYVINVNLLMRKGRVTHVYTYLPYTRTKCHNAEPHYRGFVGAATGYNFTKPEFFMKKLTNMWGCPLRISTWHQPPFIILEDDKIKGIEGLLLEEMAARKNFSILLKAVPKEDQQYTNQSYGGFMKMLADGKTNITIVGLMYDKNRLEIAEAAYTYMDVPLVLAIPKGKIMSPWERIIRPFKYIIWCCFTSSIVLGIIIIFSIKLCFKSYVQRFVFGRGFRTPFTNLWNVLYGGPLYGPLPRRNFARYILVVWMLYTWILRSAYLGELYILLQDSRARSYLETVSEVAQNNFTFYGNPTIESFLLDIPVPSSHIVSIDLDKHSPVKLFELLRDENSKIAVALLSPIVRGYNKLKENQVKQINVLPQALFMAAITYYMPKHSYLTLEFDDLLLKLRSVGLMRKFMDFYVGEDMLLKRTEAVEPTKLSLWLLLALFSIYLILLFLCLLVFLFELRSRRSTFLRRIIDFFNY